MSYSSEEESDSYSYSSYSESDDSFTSSSNLTYDHRFMVDHPSNSLMGLPLKCVSTGTTTTTPPTTNKLTPLATALPIINAYLNCEMDEPTNHNRSSLGSALPMGQLTEVISMENNYDQPFVLASNLTSEKKIALQKTHNLAPNNSNEKTTSTLVHYKTLSDSELRQIKINSEKMIQSKSAVTQKLCNTADLSQAQLDKVRTNSENIRSFQNSQSILKLRAFEDVKFASTISNPVIKNLYMGHPIESSMLGVKEEEEEDENEKEKKELKKTKCDKVIRHLAEHHRYYCDLYDNTKLKDLILDLSFKNDKDFIIIIPSVEFLKSSGLPGNVKTLEIIATHIALFHTKDKVPLMNDMNDSSLYEYQTLVKGRKIELRRLDQNTIEVNGRWIAKLDENGGGGHIYIMQKFTPVLRLEPKQNPVLKKAEKITNTTKETKKIDQVPELIDIEKDSQNLDIIRVEEELPVIDEERAKKNVDENGEDIIGTSVMLPVHSHVLYDNPKMSILVKNMLNTSYDAKLSLGSYLNNIEKEKLITNSSNPTAGNIYLKTFSVDDIYSKTQLTSLRTKEYLRPISSYTIGCDHTNIIDIDHDVKMKEYKINTSVLSIRKSELINHIAVISFPLSCGEKCSSISFQVSDEATSKDVYMSADQNILLRFSENLLDTISINASVDAFPSYMISDDEFNSDINDMVSLQLSVNKTLSNKIYKTEISFQQFNSAILPFSAPRIIRRFKSGGKALLSDIVTLSNTNRFSVGPEFIKKKTETKQIMIMSGDNRVLLLKNRMSLNFTKETFANGDKKVERYTIDKRNSRKLSFRKLVTKKGKSRLLSVTIPDPLQSNKLRSIVFKLGNTVDVGENGNIYYGGAKGGLRLYFELDSEGNLSIMYVSYSLADDELSDLMMSKKIDQLSVAKLLHNEAIMLHEKNMMISNTYLDMRTKKMCCDLKVEDKKKAKEFFTELRSDIIKHTGATQLQMDTKQFVYPSKSQEDNLINTNYFTPHVTMKTQFNDCINNHVSSSSGSKPDKISDSLIKMACEDLTTNEQKVYFHRLTSIIDVIISKL